jgi:hypothetical protein
MSLSVTGHDPELTWSMKRGSRNQCSGARHSHTCETSRASGPWTGTTRPARAAEVSNTKGSTQGES